jgi:hypothetical protein
MAAVLACGPGAVLSHDSAAALWRLRDCEGEIEISVPRRRKSRRRGIRVHRRHPGVFADATTHDRIPVPSPLRTLVDLAACADRAEITALIDQADKLDLIHPKPLRRALDGLVGEPGAPALRQVLDVATFALTDSELERARFHRTSAQQTRDALRDQAHLAAGLTPVRFTHAQVRFHAEHVERTLLAVVRGLDPRRS